MVLRRTHPAPFARIGDRYAHFIDPDHFLGRDAYADTWIAPANTAKNGKGYEVEVMVPGYTKDEISISVDDNMLEIRAEKKVDDKEYLTKEIPSGTLTRKFQLPGNVDSEKIKANLEHGILKIVVAERSKEKSERKIAID